MRELFVARQPILDAQQSLVAYELLFRGSQDNKFTHDDGDAASTQMLYNTVNVHGLNRLTRGRPAYVNMTRQLLLDETYRILPPELTVIELLETVAPEPDVVAACRRLKEQGYRLALDDFVNAPGYEPLLELADVVKLDLLSEPRSAWEKTARKLGRWKLELLAEKVERVEDFEAARDMGFAYFQGYFFARPRVMAGKDVPGFKHTYLQLLEQINNPQLDWDELESVIKQDVSLSWKLLRYLNCSTMGLSHRVRSVHHALTLLGERPFRQWASFQALAMIADDKPPELLQLALVRARFGELLTQAVGEGERRFDGFMLGLLSVLDALVDRPLAELVEQIPLSADVRAALCGEASVLRPLNLLIRVCERGQFALVQRTAEQLGVEPAVVAEAYEAAMTWADELAEQASRSEAAA